MNSTEIPQDSCSLHTHPSPQFMKRCKIAGWQQARWKVRLFGGVCCGLAALSSKNIFSSRVWVHSAGLHSTCPPPPLCPAKKKVNWTREGSTRQSFCSLGTNQMSEYTYYIGMWVTVEWAFRSQLCHFIALPARLFQAQWVTEWILPGAGR